MTNYNTTKTYLVFRCCGLPRHLNCPFTIIATRLHRDSHSSMLKQNEEGIRSILILQLVPPWVPEAIIFLLTRTLMRQSRNDEERSFLSKIKHEKHKINIYLQALSLSRPLVSRQLVLLTKSLHVRVSFFYELTCVRLK